MSNLYTEDEFNKEVIGAQLSSPSINWYQDTGEQLRTENEQLRTLLSSSLLLMLDMRLSLIGEFGVWHQAQAFTVIREQAKTLGIEVQG